MRQTKFRGKTMANGHWVYGSLIDYGDSIFAIRNRKSQPWVQADTVGQYTGLLDRNGKEIYEGDILAYGRYTKGMDCSQVIFYDGAFGFKDYFNFNPLANAPAENYEVVGNIHDNPELLNSDSRWTFAQT